MKEQENRFTSEIHMKDSDLEGARREIEELRAQIGELNSQRAKEKEEVELVLSEKESKAQVR